MAHKLVLASGSKTRRALLRNAGVPFQGATARVDEAAIRASLIAERRSAADIAAELAAQKARRVGLRHPDALVLGADQILEVDGAILGKASSRAELLDQLTGMAGKRHSLFSAAVICEHGAPVWRHIGHVRLTMRDFSRAFAEDYVARNWDEVRHSVGGYHLEGRGVQLFSAVEGDWFNVLGLPLIEVLGFLRIRGIIPK